MIGENNTKEDSVNQSKQGVKNDAKGLLTSIKKYLKELLDFREDTDHEATIEAIKADIPFKGATAWILIFAIFVASIGLNANSTAVVIGAMLISPLMGPILGIGSAFAINDIEVFKKSVVSLATMIVLNDTYDTSGPGSDDPEHDESTPAETKIVTPVLPSRTILRL